MDRRIEDRGRKETLLIRSWREGSMEKIKEQTQEIDGNRRSGQDRRKQDLLAEARELAVNVLNIPACCSMASNAIKMMAESDLKLITMMERRK